MDEQVLIQAIKKAWRDPKIVALRDRVLELQFEIERVTAERDEWQYKYDDIIEELAAIERNSYQQ